MEHNSSPENPPVDRDAAIHELLRGRQVADQLRRFLVNTPDAPAGSTKSEDLANDILDSFTNALHLLGKLDRASRIRDVSPGSDAWISNDSGESVKSSAVKNRRGRYKRRKSKETWTRDDSVPFFDDGYAWRKYGQKQILHSKFPRHYFRCTHKYEHGCEATKQVQQIQESPPLFSTTYHGRHTCQPALPNPSEHISFLDPQDTHGHSSNCILDFSEPNPNFDAHHHFPMKQEDRENLPRDGVEPVEDQHLSSDHQTTCTVSSSTLEYPVDVAEMFYDFTS